MSLKDRKGNYLRTVICVNCGLIWSDPRGDEQNIKDFYSKNYRKEYKGITRPKKKHVYRDAKEAVKRFMFFEDIVRCQDKLLDIGAGNGVFVACMRMLDVDARGIEPDESHALYAREELNIFVETGFAREIAGKEQYNIITLHHVLEHLADPLSELKNIFSLLKNEGFLVIEVPNAEDIQQDPKNRYHKAHIYTFNPETLLTLGSMAGFSVFRKKVAPLNGNIAVIFQKNINHDALKLDINGNYSKTINILNKHSNLRHFTSSVPYVKFINNIYGAIIEQMAIRKYTSDQDIIKSVCGEKDSPTRRLT